MLRIQLSEAMDDVLEVLKDESFKGEEKMGGRSGVGWMGEVE